MSARYFQYAVDAPLPSCEHTRLGPYGGSNCAITFLGLHGQRPDGKLRRRLPVARAGCKTPLDPKTVARSVGSPLVFSGGLEPPIHRHLQQIGLVTPSPLDPSRM